MENKNLKRQYDKNIQVMILEYWNILTGLECIYRAIHKGWECKDDRKLLKCDDPKVRLCNLS